MENFRSMSCKEGRMPQMENQNNENGAPPTNMQDLRSYSTSYASNYMQVHPQPSTNNRDSSKTNHNNNINNNINSINKKNKGFGSTAISYGNSTSGKGWSLSDPEIQRKKRVASYKVYAVEGKMKGSFRKSFRWIKHTCSQVVYGWW